MAQRSQARATLRRRAANHTSAAFVKAFHAKCKARTVCAPAFTWEPGCSNYDGTPVPSDTLGTGR